MSSSLRQHVLAALRTLLIAWTLLDLALTARSADPNAWVPLWFLGLYSAALVLALVLIRPEPGGSPALRGLHPALQAVIAATLALSALPDLTRRLPQAILIVIFYWQGPAWVWRALEEAWARLRARSS